MTKKRVQHKLDSSLSGGKASKILKIEEVDTKTNVELELEDLLFGNGSFGANRDEIDEDENEAEAQDSDDDIVEDETGDKVEDSEDDDDEDLFFVDEEAEAGVEKETAAEVDNEDDEDEESDSDSESDEEEVRKLPQSVWQDSDDEESDEEIDVTQVNRLKKLRKTEDETSVSATEYELRLRDQFEKLNPKPLWAQGKILQEDGEEVFRDGHSLLEEGHTSGKLESGTIDIQKLSDVTINSPSKGRITFTKFHPTSNSHIIVGSSDHTVKLFEINGKQNPHIHTIKFKDLSPEFGRFYNSGKSILTTGYRKHYYTIDVETNQTTKHNRLWGHEGSIGYFELSPNEEHVAMTESNGVINIVDTQNMMKLGNFKTNSGGCVSMKWSNNSNYLYSLTVNGTVYKWDLRTYRCVQMFNDEGGYKSNHLGLSEEDQYMSIGSQSGFVNLYDVNSLQGQKPVAKPIKSFDNLTSTVTSVAYNHDSQLMCMGSSTSKNQVRLVHLPSRKVYSNWPNPNEGGVVYKPTSIEFSPNSAYLTIGNNMGKVNLFRLNYYKAV